MTTLPCVANADGDKVFFSGSVMKSTCTLGSDDESKTLQLKTFNPSTPPKVGDAAAPTKFTITLSDCSSTMKTASIIFDSQTPSQNTDLLQLHGDNKGSNVS